MGKPALTHECHAPPLSRTGPMQCSTARPETASWNCIHRRPLHAATALPIQSRRSRSLEGKSGGLQVLAPQVQRGVGSVVARVHGHRRRPIALAQQPRRRSRTQAEFSGQSSPRQMCLRGWPGIPPAFGGLAICGEGFDAQGFVRQRAAGGLREQGSRRAATTLPRTAAPSPVRCAFLRARIRREEQLAPLSARFDAVGQTGMPVCSSTLPWGPARE